MNNIQPRSDAPNSTTELTGGHDGLADGSVELITALRSQLNEHDTRSASRRAKLASELARQQALHAAQEAERIRRGRLHAASTELDAARREYNTCATAAAQAFEELYAISCRAAIVFKAAVQAERARRDALPGLSLAWRAMRELDEQAVEPRFDKPYEFNFPTRDPRHGIASTGLEVFPELRLELTRLAAAATTEPAAPDRLEVISRRMNAKQQHDSIRVLVPHSGS
jgi:hypothetical protein